MVQDLENLVLVEQFVSIDIEHPQYFEGMLADPLSEVPTRKTFNWGLWAVNTSYFEQSGTRDVESRRRRWPHALIIFLMAAVEHYNSGNDIFGVAAVQIETFYCGSSAISGGNWSKIRSRSGSDFLMLGRIDWRSKWHRLLCAYNDWVIPASIQWWLRLW